MLQDIVACKLGIPRDADVGLGIYWAAANDSCSRILLIIGLQSSCDKITRVLNRTRYGSKITNTHDFSLNGMMLPFIINHSSSYVA